MIEVNKLMHLYRVQLPQTLRFINRLIYYFKLDSSYGQCCQKISDRLVWRSIEEILGGGVANLWGPELVEFTANISENIKTMIAEVCLDQAFMYLPRDSPRNQEEGVLKSLQVTRSDIERLYADFLFHCFPSFYQTFESFKSYMLKYEFETKESRLLNFFHAFNYNRNGYLSFHEFLMGIACIEPNLPHGEYRVRFVLRYYDVNEVGCITKELFEQMLRDMGEDGQDLNAKVESVMKSMGTTTYKDQLAVTGKNFLYAIGSHKFRGSSVLCRALKPIFSQISRSVVAKTLQKTKTRSILSSAVKKRTEVNTACPICKEKKYQVGSHSIRFANNGTFSYSILEQVAKDGEKSDKSGGKKGNKKEGKKNVLSIRQKYSNEVTFNGHSAANIAITLIRMFNKTKGNPKNPKGLLASRKEHLWTLLLSLYNDLDVLLKHESKCQKVYSPVYVIGDIHGNLEDLLTLELCLWKQIPCVGANYLFLGDYVDRGQWGLECTIYIMAFKILCPNKVTMLRGNHEVRNLQAHYTYKKECVMKYGEQMGLKVWELTNRVYDKLPVCALIDDSIYCAHGGIPHSSQDTDELIKIQRELPEPEKESTAAWEILWSDPCHMQQFWEAVEVCENSDSCYEGYIRNNKRGTAYLFNEVGAGNFLKRNGLSHIIRAHEVPRNIFQFHFGDKCITIFSCSHYCGNDNECATILVDNERMRIIELDTANNSSATN